jgi:hypothetical protein
MKGRIRVPIPIQRTGSMPYRPLFGPVESPADEEPLIRGDQAETVTAMSLIDRACDPPV